VFPNPIISLANIYLRRDGLSRAKLEKDLDKQAKATEKDLMQKIG